VQAAVQQKPSAQWPLPHCASRAQTWPIPSVAVQLPVAEHHPPEGQSVSPPQALMEQSVPVHANGTQVSCCACGQRPAPSQVAETVAIPPAHEAARHWTVG
jgi:hypothetical protein